MGRMTNHFLLARDGLSLTHAKITKRTQGLQFWSPLVGAESGHRIDSRYAQGRQITRQGGDGGKDDQHAYERRRVGKRHAEQETAQRPGKDPRDDSADRHSDARQAERLETDSRLQVAGG